MTKSPNYRIDLGNLADAWKGQHAYIRPHLSYRETQKVAKSRTKIKADQKTGELTTEIDVFAYAKALVEAAVVTWEINGIDGELLDLHDVSSENVPAVVIDCLVDAIEEFYEAQAPKLKSI